LNAIISKLNILIHIADSQMSNNPLTLGAVVSNTCPAHLPGSEPLIGRHVTLERLAQDHFPDLFENLGTHADLWAWWPDGPFSTTSEFDEYLNELLKMSADIVIYTIFLLSGPNKGRGVGLAFALSEDRLTNRVAELGLFFGPKLQRTMAGTEVVYLLGGLLFELNHRRLQWKTNSLNIPSRKAAARYGFVYEGTFRQHQINKGRNRDSAWYSIIDSEWPICKKAFEKWLENNNFDEQQRQRTRLEDIRESLK
jgi:RimJ/RimL family protein N-acetyltransferase